MKIVLFFMYLSTFSCNQSNQNRVLSAVLNKAESKSDFINTNAKTLKDRFSPPEGFSRKAVSENSFTHYLRNIPFKPAGSKVKYYDGKIKFENVHEAVIDMEISGQNL